MFNIDERKIVLELISKKDARMNWYNLEIALSRQGYGGDINAVHILEHLVFEGFLEAIPNVDAQTPTYKITESGREKLNSVGNW